MLMYSRNSSMVNWGPQFKMGFQWYSEVNQMQLGLLVKQKGINNKYLTLLRCSLFFIRKKVERVVWDVFFPYFLAAGCNWWTCIQCLFWSLVIYWYLSFWSSVLKCCGQHYIVCLIDVESIFLLLACLFSRYLFFRGEEKG